MTFQTSDFAKLALILFVARALSVKQDVIKDFKSAFIPIMLPVLITCLLILPANLSTAAFLFLTCLILMVVGRVRLKFIFSLIGIGVGLFCLYLAVAKLTGNTGRIATWESRMENFMGHGGTESYQAQQGRIAIAGGGLIGRGPGNSLQRNFLPHPYSDFIYAIIVEEYGLIGGALIVILYLVLFFRSVRIAQKIGRAHV